MTVDNNKFSTVEEAIEAIKQGKMVIVADNEDRENEGDLICAAETITPEIINFMATEARGLICMPVSREIAQKLNFYPMAKENTDTENTAFTVSIDGTPRNGVTTGISAKDRAQTIKICTRDNAQPEDLRRPGHIFPLIARDGGVLQRQGQTEASVDLSKLAGFKSAGVICEIANEDGSMARRDELFDFANKHKMPFITVEQIMEYRLKTETLITKEAEAKLPTKFGDFTIHAYREKFSNQELIALVYGDINSSTEPVLCRLHSECLTGDALSSLRCDCQSQLHYAQEQIAQNKSGILIYLRQEGRGIGLVNKIKAYAFQDAGDDTFEANHKLGFQDDLREFWSAVHVLKDFGVSNIDLITNNPKKIQNLESLGININKQIKVSFVNEHNKSYLQAKKDKHCHHIEI